MSKNMSKKLLISNNFIKTKKSTICLEDTKTSLEDTKTKKFTICLEDTKKYLDIINLKTFLICGTALGMHRNGTFIPHDKDIDIATMYEDFNENIEKKMIDILKKNNYDVIHILGEINHGREYSFRHPNGVKIDLFLYYKEDNFFWHASYFNLCDLKKYGKCRYKFSEEALQLEDIKFNNKLYKIVSIKFLEEEYGLDWKTPKEFSYKEGVTYGKYLNIIDE
jgi:phosphorylcholine metabolism protein LicD